MKYFIDVEFLEGTQDKTFLGFKCGETKPTIDLISIGILAEDGREYYAISKDFNLKEAWNSYEYTSFGKDNKYKAKERSIRENILKPIYYEWAGKDINFHILGHFNYHNFKKLIKKYGKTNKQIAEEIIEFSFPKINDKDVTDYYLERKSDLYKPEFYSYCADYDWVVFCWLFGKVNDLPNGIPMYCIDLKQILDEKVKNDMKEFADYKESKGLIGIHNSFDWHLKQIQKLPNYPQQTIEYSPLTNAKWNFELFKFLENL